MVVSFFAFAPIPPFWPQQRRRKRIFLSLPGKGTEEKEETMRREGDKVTTTTSKGKWEGGEGRRGPRPRRHSQTPLFCTHSVTKAISPCPPPHLFLSPAGVRNIVVVRVKNGSLRLAKWPSEGRRKNHQSLAPCRKGRKVSNSSEWLELIFPPPKKKDGARFFGAYPHPRPPQKR